MTSTKKIYTTTIRDYLNAVEYAPKKEHPESKSLFNLKTWENANDYYKCEKIFVDKKAVKQTKSKESMSNLSILSETCSQRSQTFLKKRIRFSPPHFSTYLHWISFIGLLIMSSVHSAMRVPRQISSASEEQFARLLGRCQLGTADFDDCMRGVFNDLRAYYPTGMPAYNIKPFDPHRASFIELRRGDMNGLVGMRLILRNVSEYGWTNSKITKYRTDMENQRIIYSQFFPEKSLEGYYEMTGNMLGAPLKRKGYWNMTLIDYSQTTSIRRLGGPGSLLKVHVEVDNLGDLKMHISDVLAQGRQNLDNISDTVINSMWQIGFPMIKPMINELVSTAFTDIFNESFRYFPIEKFIR